MSTPHLPPKPTDSLPPTLVREYQQRRVRVPVLLTASVGLAISLSVIYWLHPTLSRMPNWHRVSGPWLLALAATALACGIVWRWRRVPKAEVARELDRQWSAKNRLEAATELGESNSPLTAAQHAEAAAFLTRTPKPRFRWDLLLMGVATILLIAHLGTATVWIEQAPKPPPEAPPRASIQWKSPKAEIKATPIMEVPLVAVAESSSGLKNLTLYVSINGEAGKAVPIPAEPLAKAGSAEIKTSLLLDELGVEPFDMISYYLQADRIYSGKLPPTASPIQFIQVRPFRDEAIILKPKKGNGKFDMIEFLEMITKVKIAQLLLLKQNFVLTHAEIDHRDVAFREENDRVGHDQDLLANKTDELKQLAIANGVHPLVIDKLGQAEPLMREASSKILSTRNQEGLIPQGKSLSAITAIEKLVRKIIPPPGQSNSKPGVKDPFADEQRFKLKPRESTVAGKLEELARQQEKLVADLKKPASAKDSSKAPDTTPTPPSPSDTTTKSNPPATGQDQPGTGQPSPQGQPGDDGGQPQSGTPPGSGSSPAPKPPGEEGTLAQRQDAIRNALSKAADDAAFEEDVNQLVRSAAGHSGVANQQLEAQDNKAALEPASAALNDLRKAIQLLAQHGREQAKAAMADAQVQLNDKTASEMKLKGQTGNQAAAEHQKTAQELAQLKQELQQKAEKQQETGSSAAAQALAKLANALNDSGLKKNLETLTKDPANAAASADVIKKLAELANQSAAGQAGFERDPAKALQEAIAHLESGQASLERIAAKGDESTGSGSQAAKDILAQMQVDVQRAASLVNSPTVQGKADGMKRQLEKQYVEWSGANLVLPLKEISGPLKELISLLKQSLAAVSREETLRRAELDEAPVMYRDAVSAYLESLSLDYEKPDGMPVPPKEKPSASP